MQHQKFGEQHRHENWLKQGYINRDHKKLTPPDGPKTVISSVQHDPVETTILHNLKMLTEKHNNENLAITLFIVETGLIAYRFWYKINGIIIIHSRWCRSECISL